MAAPASASRSTVPVASVVSAAPAPGSVLDSLDRGTALVRRLPGWAGVLALTALPVRLLTVGLFWQAFRLGNEAASHGDALTGLALITLGAWLVAQIGRQFFARACRLALASERPVPGTVLRIPGRELLPQLVAALVVELLFWLTLPALVLAPVLAALAATIPAGSALAGSDGGGGFSASAKGVTVRALLVLLPLSLVALVCAGANLHGLAQLGQWLVGGVAGVELGRWSVVLSFANPLYVLLLVAGATLVLEPFWLATWTAEVVRQRARSTGEDLVQWCGELEARS